MRTTRTTWTTRSLAARATVVAAAALALLAGCEKASTKEGPTAPLAAPPADVVATVSTASLAAAIGGVRAYADAAQPGAGAFIADPMILAGLGQMVGAASLDGLDAAQGLHLIVAEGNSAGAVVLGKVADASKLDAGKGGAHVINKDGWAVIGAKPTAEHVDAWARGVLVKHAPTAAVEATVYLDRVMKNHAAEVQMIREQVTAGMGAAGNPAAAAMMQDYVDGMMSLAGDTERVVATLSADGKLAELDLALAPKAGTRLATFVAAQKASDFALLGSLPAGSPGEMLMAGHFVLGPYRDAWMGMMSRMWGMGSAGPAMSKAFLAIGELATGEFAASMTMSPTTGMSMVQIVPVSDAAAAEKAAREVAVALGAGTPIDSMGIKMTQSGLLDVAQHDGKPIHGMKTVIDLDSVPAEQRLVMEAMYKQDQVFHVGFTDGALIGAMGGVERVTQAIDAMKGAAPRLTPAPSSAALIDISKARHDSMVFVMDLAALKSAVMGAIMPGMAQPAGAPAPVAMGLGFDGGAAHFRLAVPVEAVRAFTE